MENMENYFSSIEPFYKIFKLLPLNFEKPIRKGNLKLTYLSLLTTAFVFVILFVMIIFIISNHIIFTSEKQAFLALMFWSWFLIAVYPTIIFQLTFQIIKTKDIRIFFNFMDDIDCKFRKLCIKIDHQRHRKIIFRSTLLMASTLLLRFLPILIFSILNKDKYKTNGNMTANETSYFGFLVYISAFTLQFVFLSYLLRERFSALKELLE